MDIWGKTLLCLIFYFSPLLEFLVPINVRLNQYLSSVTLSRFCWWSQLEIKRSQQSERRTPLRLSKEIVATTSFILYATSDRNQMKRKKKTGLMSQNCSFTFPPCTNNVHKLYLSISDKKCDYLLCPLLKKSFKAKVFVYFLLQFFFEYASSFLLVLTVNIIHHLRHLILLTGIVIFKFTRPHKESLWSIANNLIFAHKCWL